MSRFDQCTETCTTDCGHCKGRPVEALRAEVARLQSLADMMGANVDALEAEVARLTEHDRIRAKVIADHQGRLIAADAALAEVARLTAEREAKDRVIEAAKAYVAEFRWMLESLRQIENRGHDNTVRVALLDAVDALESTGDEP